MMVIITPGPRPTETTTVTATTTIPAVDMVVTTATPAPMSVMIHTVEETPAPDMAETLDRTVDRMADTPDLMVETLDRMAVLAAMEIPAVEDMDIKPALNPATAAEISAATMIATTVALHPTTTATATVTTPPLIAVKPALMVTAISAELPETRDRMADLMEVNMETLAAAMEDLMEVLDMEITAAATEDHHTPVAMTATPVILTPAATTGKPFPDSSFSGCNGHVNVLVDAFVPFLSNFFHLRQLVFLTQSG